MLGFATGCNRVERILLKRNGHGLFANCVSLSNQLRKQVLVATMNAIEEAYRHVVPARQLCRCSIKYRFHAVRVSLPSGDYRSRGKFVGPVGQPLQDFRANRR